MRHKTTAEQFFSDGKKSKEEQIREVLEQTHNPMFGLDIDDSTGDLVHIATSRGFKSIPWREELATIW